MQEKILGRQEIKQVSMDNRMGVKVTKADRVMYKEEMHSMLMVKDSRGSSLWPPTGMLRQVVVFLGGQLCSSAALTAASVYNKLQFYWVRS